MIVGILNNTNGKMQLRDTEKETYMRGETLKKKGRLWNKIQTSQGLQGRNGSP